MPTIAYDCPAGPLPAYLAVPSGQGQFTGVVVIQDALGMTEDLRRITDRFAAHGYLALAPALYGRGQKLRCIVQTFRALHQGSGMAGLFTISPREQNRGKPSPGRDAESATAASAAGRQTPWADDRPHEFRGRYLSKA